MKERKEKGIEGGSVQLMNLDAGIIAALQELKEHYRVGTNSKAALQAIKDSAELRNEVKTLRAKLQEANETVRMQQNTLDNIAGNLREYQTERKFITRWDWLDE